MNHGFRDRLARHAKHFGRLLATLPALPALVLSPITAQAILIHDHDGQDLHFHTITPNGSEDYPKDWSCEQERDHRAAEPPKESCNTIVLELGLPDALPRVRGLSAGNVVGTYLARLPLPVAIAPDPAASTPCPNARPWSATLDLRPHSMVAGILLANHALLL